jgi:hypothetical protein
MSAEGIDFQDGGHRPPLPIEVFTQTLQPRRNRGRPLLVCFAPRAARGCKLSGVRNKAKIRKVLQRRGGSSALPNPWREIRARAPSPCQGWRQSVAVAVRPPVCGVQIDAAADEGARGQVMEVSLLLLSPFLFINIVESTCIFLPPLFRCPVNKRLVNHISFNDIDF